VRKVAPNCGALMLLPVRWRLLVTLGAVQRLAHSAPPCVPRPIFAIHSWLPVQSRGIIPRLTDSRGTLQGNRPNVASAVFPPTLPVVSGLSLEDYAICPAGPLGDAGITPISPLGISPKARGTSHKVRAELFNFRPGSPSMVALAPSTAGPRGAFRLA